MADRDNLDSRRLDEGAARRLLERATELDARLASESTVAELRDAARAAGISEEAFNRALSEVGQPAKVLRVAAPRPRWRGVAIATLLVLLGVTALVASRITIRAPAPPARAVEAAPPVLEPPTPPPAQGKSPAKQAKQR